MTRNAFIDVPVPVHQDRQRDQRHRRDRSQQLDHGDRRPVRPLGQPEHQPERHGDDDGAGPARTRPPAASNGAHPRIRRRRTAGTVSATTDDAGGKYAGIHELRSGQDLDQEEQRRAPRRHRGSMPLAGCGDVGVLASRSGCGSADQRMLRGVDRALERDPVRASGRAPAGGCRCRGPRSCSGSSTSLPAPEWPTCTSARWRRGRPLR